MAGASWSVIDRAGRRKPAWYALRAANADQLITVQPVDEGLEVALVNQGAEDWVGTLRHRMESFDGTRRDAGTQKVVVPARGVVRVPVDVAWTDPLREVLVAELDDRRALWFGSQDRDLAYEPDALEAEATRTDTGYDVVLRARSLVRDIALHVDRLAPDATVDDTLVTLLAGEARTVRVRTVQEIDARALTRRPVLATVNDAVCAARAAVG